MSESLTSERSTVDDDDDDRFTPRPTGLQWLSLRGLVNGLPPTVIYSLIMLRWRAEEDQIAE